MCSSFPGKQKNGMWCVMVCSNQLYICTFRHDITQQASAVIQATVLTRSMSCKLYFKSALAANQTQDRSGKQGGHKSWSPPSDQLCMLGGICHKLKKICIDLPALCAYCTGSQSQFSKLHFLSTWRLKSILSSNSVPTGN